MLSASKRLKRVFVPQWKTRNLSSISSFLFNLCGYRNYSRGAAHFSLKKPDAKYISAPVEVCWTCPLYLMPSTLIFEYRSLVTKTSSEEEEEGEAVAYHVLNEILSEVENGLSSMKELSTDHIDKLCRKRNLRAAASLLRLLHEKYAINSLQGYNLLLATACGENNLELVSQIFKDMLVFHLSMNSNTYLNVAKAFSQSNDSNLVLGFVKEISELTCTGSVTVINRIIYAFAECGSVDKALLIFYHMKSLECKPDLITHNTVLGILGKAARVDEMLHEFASMKEANIMPDVISYNTLINSLKKVGRLDLCVALLKEMVKEGLEPDLRTYTALIESFGRSGNIEESLRLFEDMKCRHIRPSIYIYRSLISNLKRMGKLELSLKFSEEMNACLPDLVGPKDFKRKNR